MCSKAGVERDCEFRGDTDMTLSFLIMLGGSGLVSILLTLIVILVVAGLLFWVVNKLSAAFGIPEPVKTVIIVILVIVVVLILLGLVTGSVPLKL